jgi:hypothetical protein
LRVQQFIDIDINENKDAAPLNTPCDGLPPAAGVVCYLLYCLEYDLVVILSLGFQYSLQIIEVFLELFTRRACDHR